MAISDQYKNLAKKAKPADTKKRSALKDAISKLSKGTTKGTTKGALMDSKPMQELKSGVRTDDPTYGKPYKNLVPTGSSSKSEGWVPSPYQTMSEARRNRK